MKHRRGSLHFFRGPYAVGEHAVALMLSLNRHIARSYRNARMGNFSLDGAMIGQTLNGKRVGIIGTGLIGTITAKIMKQLGRALSFYIFIKSM